jgi:hypothetical protein
VVEIFEVVERWVVVNVWVGVSTSNILFDSLPTIKKQCTLSYFTYW